MNEPSEIGDISLDKDAIEFAVEFMRRMREHPDIPISLEPTPRQAIALPTFLSARWMREGFLTAQDLVVAAVVTSYAENQRIACEVAMEILSGKHAKEQECEQEEGQQERELVIEEQWQLFFEDMGQGRPEAAEDDSGSGSGPGEERFSDWVRKFQGDKEYRDRIRDFAEQISLENHCSQTGASYFKEDSGVFAGEKLGQLMPGDDYSLIDFEESIENILGSGRGLSEMRYEDFIVRERRGTRKAVVILEDISGSMRAGLDGSIMCAVMLLYALRKHEVALAFFEGNPYVIKEFFDRRPIEETIDDLFSAQTMFGTMGGNVLRWAREQLEVINGRYYEKTCIICSDMGFFDIKKVIREIELMKESEIKVVIILPPTFIYESSVEAVKEAGPIIARLGDASMAMFPEILSEALSGSTL